MPCCEQCQSLKFTMTTIAHPGEQDLKPADMALVQELGIGTSKIDVLCCTSAALARRTGQTTALADSMSPQ